MEYRQLGRSGIKVPELCFGCGTFGGANEFFDAWGATSDIAEARKIVDICVEAGLNFFDTADIYSDGRSETVLGGAIQHLRRQDILISTKATFRFGTGPNDFGSSRYHLIQALEGSLKRLGTDYLDVYHLHGFDALTPVEETLSTLDTFVREGKVRYIACSNFSGWHLMKSLSVSERYGWSRYVGHQVYYSLVGRDYEWELMPLAADQGVGALIWSPLGWGRLTGKIRRSHTSISIKSSTPSTPSPTKPAKPSLRSLSTGSCAAPPSQPSSLEPETSSSSARISVRLAGA
jgi:aryl-alcohol dehydrogenase-like predicted oxidoreductase